MALTRKFLTALGIEAEKVDEIINAHAETVDALKAERDTYKDKAEKFDAEQDKVTKLEKQVKDLEDSNKDSYKVKYEAIKEEFADYKKGIESEKSKAEKTNAFKALLKEIGISEKRIDSVTKISDIDGIKLDKDGKIEGVDELKKSLSEEWADFIVKEGSKGAEVAKPPVGNGGAKTMTREQIDAIKDTAERQRLMLENKDLYLKPNE